MNTEPKYNGKLICGAYTPDTNVEVTDKHLNAFIGREISWTQIKRWEAGDGDPGMNIPEGVYEDDPRVEALWNKYMEDLEEGRFDEREIVQDIVVLCESDDAILLYVGPNAEELYEIEDDY